MIYEDGGRVGRGRSGRRVENLRCRQAKAEKTSSAALWPACAWVGDGAAALVRLGGVSDAFSGGRGRCDDKYWEHRSERGPLFATLLLRKLLLPSSTTN